MDSGRISAMGLSSELSAAGARHPTGESISGHRRRSGPALRQGGRLRVIATVQDPLVVQAMLDHLTRSGAPAPPGPPASRCPVALSSATPRSRSACSA